MSNPPPLPDEIIEHLRQLQGDAEKGQWLVGDFLVGVVDELAEIYERAGVRKARTWLVRHMANRIGVDETTLRDRECVARFFPQEARDKYPFSWSQWRALKSAGDKWEEYAVWATENLPAPVMMIREKIKGNGDAEPKWIYKWNKAMEFFEDISLDEEVPVMIRSFTGAVYKSKATFDDKPLEPHHK